MIFFRGTPSWWKETMQRTGFSRTGLQPLVWGRYTTAGTISGYRGLLPTALQQESSYLKDIPTRRSRNQAPAMNLGTRASHAGVPCVVNLRVDLSCESWNTKDWRQRASAGVFWT